MKKALIVLMCVVLCAGLCACKGTGTALTVNNQKVDQAEYAFYLNYNRLKLFAEKSSYTNADLENARKAAVTQIIAAEVVRDKCREIGLKPSTEQKAQLAFEKAEIIKSLGGEKKYKSYLKKSYLTERTYDKLAANEIYYNLLSEYVTNENADIFTREYLQNFYAKNYICIKYIRISLYDENGEALSQKETEKAFELAEKVAQKAQSGEDFDALILQYSDDTAVKGGTEGLIVSSIDAKNQPYLQFAFALSDGQTSDVCLQNDGFYIVKRLKASDEYFEPNISYIKDAAAQVLFEEQLDEWTEQAQTEVKKSVSKIRFDNLHKYVK